MSPRGTYTYLDQAGTMLHQLARFSLPPADIPRRPSAPTRPRLASRFRLNTLRHPAALPLVVRLEQYTSRLFNDAADTLSMQGDILLPLPLFGRSHFLIFNLF